jgi:hypothetical protein
MESDTEYQSLYFLLVSLVFGLRKIFLLQRFLMNDTIICEYKLKNFLGIKYYSMI